MGLTKAQLEALNVASFPNNNEGLITPQILRDYNSASIANTVNQDTYTTDSASFDSRINALDPSGSVASFTALNDFTASQLTINTGYNIFTQSADGRLDNLEATTSSLNSSITQLNANTASQQSSINQLNTNSASVNSSISQLNASSASQQQSINSLNVATQSLQQQLTNIGSQSGSWVTESETGSFARVNVTNTFTQPQIISAAVTASAAKISGLNYPTADNGVKSFIQTDGAGNLSLQYVDTIWESVRAGENVVKGTPLYISGSQGSAPIVYAADASNPAKMPVTFIAGQAYTAGNTYNAIVLGLIEGMDLTGYTAGQTVYVAEGGGWTTNLPSGSSSITQVLGVVTKGGSGGKGLVLNPGPAQLPGLQTGYAWVGNGSNRPVAVSTSSFSGGGSTDITALNQFTASQQLLNGTFATTGSNTFVGQQNIQNKLVIEEAGNPLVYTELVQDTLTNKLQVNQAGASGIDFNANVEMNELTASLQQGYVWVGNASGITTLVSTSSFFVSGSGPTDITALNAFTASQLTINTGYNTFTSSQLTKDATLETYTSSVDSSLTNLNGFTSSANQRLTAIETVSGSWITESETGSFAKVNVANTFTENQTISQSKSLNFGSAGNIRSSDGTGVVVFDTVGGYQHRNFTSGEYYFEQNASSPMYILNRGGAAVSISGSATEIQGVDFIPFSASLNSRILAGGGSINTGSFATTGSNVFTGDQTLIDAGGNTITLSDTSGSLMLVAKTYTSASLHLSSSATPKVNLIWKDNSNTADTIISGSNNIFVNPSAPTAGFKRYVGTSNIYTHGSSVPQISGSMGWSPSMNGNIFSHTQTNPFTFRGPVSSSASNYNHNIVMGGIINLGSSATLNAEKAVAGLNMNNNAMFGSTMTIIANTTTLTNAIAANSNISFGATMTLNSISSSISYNSNINNGSLTLNNRYSPSVGSVAGTLSPRINVNTIYGTGHAINLDGTNVASTTQTKQFNYNILAGSFLTASVPDGDNSAVLATGMIGNGLIITGSTLPSSATGADQANSGQGSMFVGRFNAQDGTKSKTAETVFAVGTGTSYTNRKTGFLIDSGSNSYFEGSVNVSGSLLVNASEIITGSLSIKGNTTFTSVGGNTTNIILGNNALASATTANQSVAIGENALNKTTTGGNNFALGSNAMFENTTGNQNVAIGVGALYSNVAGTKNVAIGNDAALQASGSQNTYIGSGAGQNITGSNNTIIGAYTGTAGSPLSDSIILADGAGNVRAQYDSSAWSLQGEIKLNKGSNKPCDIVTVGSTGLTVSNSLVTTNSIILVTTQNSDVAGDEYPAVVSAKTTGQFSINHNYSGNLQVAYLIINPTA